MTSPKLKAVMAYLEARLCERSTWLGIGAGLTGTISAVATLHEPKLMVEGLTAGIALCGIVAALLPNGTQA